LYNPGTLVDYTLRELENSHHDCKGIGQDKDSHESFEYPLEKYKSLKVVEVIAFYYHGYKLVARNKGQYHPGYWDDYGFRQGSYHGVDAGVKEHRLSRGVMIFLQKSVIFSILFRV